MMLCNSIVHLDSGLETLFKPDLDSDFKLRSKSKPDKPGL